MPVTIAQLLNRRAEVKVPFEGDYVNVIFNPAKFTPKFLSGLQQSENEGKLNSWTVEYMKELVLGWDLLENEETGEVMAISEENFARLPFYFLLAMQSEMQKEVVPNVQSGGRSASIS